MDWYIVQLKRTGRIGIGLYGKMIVNGIRQHRYLVWLPHLGPLEYVGERRIIDGKRNYITVKPESVSSVTKVSHGDELNRETKRVWAKTTV